MFNRALFAKEIREHRWALILGTLLLSAAGIVLAWGYTVISQYLNNIPQYIGPELAEQFDLVLKDYSTYLWSQWNAKNLLQFAAILALIMAAPAIAGEVGRGSIHYLTSLPISRSTILFSKALAGMAILTCVIWAATAALLVTGAGIDPGLSWEKIVLATVLTNIGVYAIYGIGLIFSVLCREAVKAGALAAGTLLIWSAASFFPATRFLSPFWHMRGGAMFAGESFPWLSLAVLVGLVLGTLYTAGRVFRGRQF